MAVYENNIQPLFSYKLKIALITLTILLVLPSCGQRGQKKLLQEHDDKYTILYQQGRYSEVADVTKKALKVTEEILGPDHPQVEISLNKLAELFYNQGRYSEAEPLL